MVFSAVCGPFFCLPKSDHLGFGSTAVDDSLRGLLGVEIIGQLAGFSIHVLKSQIKSNLIGLNPTCPGPKLFGATRQFDIRIRDYCQVPSCSRI